MCFFLLLYLKYFHIRDIRLILQLSKPQHMSASYTKQTTTTNNTPLHPTPRPHPNDQRDKPKKKLTNYFVVRDLVKINANVLQRTNPDVRSDRNKSWRRPRGWKINQNIFSLTRVVTVDLAPSLRETPRKENNPELPHKTGKGLHELTV